MLGECQICYPCTTTSTSSHSSSSFILLLKWVRLFEGMSFTKEFEREREDSLNAVYHMEWTITRKLLGN